MSLAVKPIKIIEPHSKWKLLDYKELLYYKDLVYYMVLRDVTVLYKQTVLGVSWAVLNPLLNAIIFTIIGSFADIPSDGIPYFIFSYTGMIAWTYFDQGMTFSSNSLVQNAGIFTKVYFPRMIIPLTPVLSKLVDFIISFSFLIAIMIYYSIYPGLNILVLPLLTIILILFTFASGLWLSSLAVQYRDVRFLIPFLSKFLMFVSPVLFPASSVKEKFGETAYMLYGLYPMTGVLEGFRSALLNRTPMPWDLIFLGSITTIIILLTGLYHFKKSERYFADVV